jgi:hypothetical protein
MDAPFLTSNAKLFFQQKSQELNNNFLDYKQESYRAHFSHSQETINDTIQELKGRAIFFGVGSMHDLPSLATLAAKFKHIVLVDINLDVIRKELQKLPPELQKKFSCRLEDLTGIFGQLSQKIELLVEQKLAYDEFVLKTFELLLSLDVKRLNFEELKPSFICSSLLCSQLVGGVVTFLEQISRESYKKSFKLPSEQEEAYDNWLKQIQVRHVQDLYHLATIKKAIVYFADHFSAKGVCLVSSRVDTPKKFELGEASFPGAKAVQQALKEKFVTQQEKFWTWSLLENVSEGTITIENDDETESVFPSLVEEYRECQITSLVLKPKDI